MRIVVAGAGEFGISIAQLLAEEKCDIVVVEADPSRAEMAQRSLDCLVVNKDCAFSETYVQQDIKTADLFIACLESDEKNIVACMLAKYHGIPKTVACVRNVDYVRYEKEIISGSTKVDYLLNTDYIVAKEINKILTASSSLDVDEFAGGKVKMFEAKIPEDSKLLNKPLKDLELPENILITLILHKQKVIVPRGDSVISKGDYVYFVGLADNIAEFAKEFSATYDKPKRVMMIGAGRTGRFTAPMLEKHGMIVKAIEKNEERCQLLAAELEKGLVLCGDGTNMDLLSEEGIADSDVVLAVTDDDRLNLMVALLAKHLGAKRTLVRVAQGNYAELMEKLGVDVVLSTRDLAMAALLKFVHKGNVLNVSMLDDVDGEALEIVVGNNSLADGKCVKDLALPNGALLCAIVGAEGAVIPKGKTQLHGGDRIVLFVQDTAVNEITTIFEERN